MWARAIKINWRHLFRFQESEPVVLLFHGGTAALLTGANPEQKVVFLKDPLAPDGEPPIAVDELRLCKAWTGEAILVRASRGRGEADAPFTLAWITSVVMGERRSLIDIAIASLTISLLTIFPPFIVMAVVNRVLQFHSLSTLTLLSAVLAVIFLYETLLGHSRRLAVAVVSARLDAKLNLHVFNRLLRLPLDYFERNPAGETMYKLGQVQRVRAFLTGKLMTTVLDLITLCVLLPFLFILNAALAWIVLACAVLITLIILAYLGPLKVLYERVNVAESAKAATIGESIVGIRTVKSLALEPQRRAQWDERVAEAGKSQLDFSELANWPQTLVTPIERMMSLGTMMIGAYLALSDTTGYMVGSLFAFMMLGGRVAQPLVGLARLVEDYEEVRAAIGQAGYVLNRPLEVDAPSGGLRPQFRGGIEFHDLTFTYPGNKTPALDRDQLQGARGHDARRRRTQRVGQVDDRAPAAGHQPRIQRLREDRRGRSARDQSAPSASELRRRAPGQFPLPRIDPRQHHRRPAGSCDGGRRQGHAPGRRGGVHRAPAEWLQYLHRGRVAQSVGRPEAAPGDRARADPQSQDTHPRRGHERARSGERGGRQRRSDAHRARTDDGDRFPSAFLVDRLRSDSRARTGQDSRRRAARGAARAMLALSPALDAAEPASRRAGRAAGADTAGDGAVELRYEIAVLSKAGNRRRDAISRCAEMAGWRRQKQGEVFVTQAITTSVFRSVLERALVRLPSSTRDARELVYRRARESLVSYMRAGPSPATEDRIRDEIRRLEEVIRQVEAEFDRPILVEEIPLRGREGADEPAGSLPPLPNFAPPMSANFRPVNPVPANLKPINLRAAAPSPAISDPGESAPAPAPADLVGESSGAEIAYSATPASESVAAENYRARKPRRTDARCARSR